MDREEAQEPDSVEADFEEQVLSAAYERYRARGRGATFIPRKRFGAPASKPGAQSPSTAESSRGGFDWALVDELEKSDGETTPSGPSGTTRSFKWTPGSGLHRGKDRPGSAKYDPVGLGRVLSSEVQKRQWEEQLKVGSVVGLWPQIVGDLIAKNCQVESFEEGKLVARAVSSAWAQQLRLLIPEILARVDNTVGPGVVTSIVVVGPRPPSWRHGTRHVPGRGPRDTYG